MIQNYLKRILVLVQKVENYQWVLDFLEKEERRLQLLVNQQNMKVLKKTQPVVLKD